MISESLLCALTDLGDVTLIHSLCSGSLTELSMNIPLTRSQQEICVVLILKRCIEPFVKSTWLRRKTKPKQLIVCSGKANGKENLIMQGIFYCA